MGIPFLVAVLSVLQASDDRASQNPRVDFKAVFDRVSKEANLDGAGLVLSSVLSNEATIRAAFSTPVVLDERTVYILYGGNWGSRARLTWEERLQRHRIRVESTSTKPELI